MAVVSLVIWTCRIIRWIKDGFMIDDYGYQIEPDEPKNCKVGCRRTAVILAGIAAIVCASVFLEMPIRLNNQSHLELRKYHEQDVTMLSPDQFDPKLPLRLKDDFWLNLRKGQFVGICVSVFLFGAAIGFCAVWFGYRYFEELVLNCMGKNTD
ncbi:MAG: hypothetical protein E4H40_00995 [Candidatus Brocadiia bacterium]|nr:MAG: hypothetical protein E4H40_00995 [Candidatus Brocadiia bacterium]